MQIEIDDELEDRIEEVHNKGVGKGIYPVGITPRAVIDKLVMAGLVGEEKKLGLTPKEEVEEHNCTENMDYGKADWRFIRFEGDTVQFYGKCSVCGKKLKNVFQYVKTWDREIVEREAESSFIHADKWRKMDASDIISSIDIGLSFLDEKGFSKEHNGQLLVLIEEIAKMLVREV